MIISQAILETTIYKHHLAVLHVFVFGKSQEYRFGWFRFVAGMGPSLGGCFLLSFPGQCKRLYPWLRFEVREVTSINPGSEQMPVLDDEDVVLVKLYENHMKTYPPGI